MSRVEFAARGGGQAVLEKLIREQIGRLIAELPPPLLAMPAS
jgi:hypothetical protein